jgi:hypothetical protein
MLDSEPVSASRFLVVAFLFVSVRLLDGGPNLSFSAWTSPYRDQVGAI